MNQLLTNSGTQATLSRKSSKEVPDDAIKRNKIIKAADESKHLTLCLLGNFVCFLSSADFFQNQLFFEKLFRNTIRERSGSVVECLTRDQRAAGSSLTGVTALCP